MKSGNLNFLEPSGPLQACNGAALPLPLLLGIFVRITGSAILVFQQFGALRVNYFTPPMDGLKTDIHLKK
jgi:hypothetical protein